MTDAEGQHDETTDTGQTGHPQTWRHRWAKTSLPNKLIASATVVIAVAALVSLTVAIGQWIIMGKQLDEMASTGQYAERQAILAIGQLAVANRASLAAQAQAQAAQAQVEILRRNFIKEQRPHVWFTNDPQSIQWDDAKGAGWTYHYTNYGKSPAVDIRSVQRLIVAPDAIKKLKPIPLPHERTGGFLPPTKSDFATAYSRGTREELDDARQHDGWIAIYGSFVYHDGAGNLYITDFCGFLYGNGAVGICVYDHTKRQNPN